MSPIAIQLRHLREAAGVSQAELAARVGARQALISDLETGKTNRINFELLDRLCAALKCSPNDILARRGRRQS